jgi:hypothetical protein
MASRPQSVVYAIEILAIRGKRALGIVLPNMARHQHGYSGCLAIGEHLMLLREIAFRAIAKHHGPAFQLGITRDAQANNGINSDARRRVEIRGFIHSLLLAHSGAGYAGR